MLSKHDLFNLSDKEKTSALSSYFQQVHIIEEEDALTNIERLGQGSPFVQAPHDASKKDAQMATIDLRLKGVIQFVYEGLITREIFCKSFENNKYTLLSCASTNVICAYITFEHELFALGNHTGCVNYSSNEVRERERLPKFTSVKHGAFLSVIATLLLKYRTDIDMREIVAHLTTLGFDFNRIVRHWDEPLVHQYLTRAGRSLPIVTAATFESTNPTFTDARRLISPDLRMIQFLIQKGGLNLELLNDQSLGVGGSLTILELCLNNLCNSQYDYKQVIHIIILLLNNGAAISNVPLECLQNVKEKFQHLAHAKNGDAKICLILAVVNEQLFILQGNSKEEAFTKTKNLYLSGTTGQPLACVKLADVYFQTKQYEAAYQWYQTAAIYSKKRLHQLVGIECAIELFFFRHEKDMPYNYIAIAEGHDSLTPKIRIQLAQLVFRQNKNTEQLQRAFKHNYVAFKETVDDAVQRSAVGNVFDFWAFYERTAHQKFDFLRDITSDSRVLFDDKPVALPMRDEHEIFKFFESGFVQRVLQTFEAHHDHLAMLHLRNEETTEQHKTTLECCAIVSMIPCMVDYATCVIEASKKDDATTNMMLTAGAAEKLRSFLTDHREKLQIPQNILTAMSSQPMPVVDSKKTTSITQFAIWEEYKASPVNTHATSDQIELNKLIAKLPAGNPIQKQYREMILARPLKDCQDTLTRIISNEIHAIGEWKDERQQQHLTGIYRECLALLKGNSSALTMRK